MIRVCGTTTDLPPLANGGGWLTCGSSTMRIVRSGALSDAARSISMRVRGTTTVCPDEKGGGWLATVSSITRITGSLRASEVPPITTMAPIYSSTSSFADEDDISAPLTACGSDPNVTTRQRIDALRNIIVMWEAAISRSVSRTATQEGSPLLIWGHRGCDGMTG